MPDGLFSVGVKFSAGLSRNPDTDKETFMQHLKTRPFQDTDAYSYISIFFVTIVDVTVLVFILINAFLANKYEKMLMNADESGCKNSQNKLNLSSVLPHSLKVCAKVRPSLNFFWQWPRPKSYSRVKVHSNIKTGCLPEYIAV